MHDIGKNKLLMLLLVMEAQCDRIMQHRIRACLPHLPVHMRAVGVDFIQSGAG